MESTSQTTPEDTQPPTQPPTRTRWHFSPSTLVTIVGLGILSHFTITPAPVWAHALAVGFSLFGIALHEIGHWAAARRHDVPVPDITLAWFGARTDHGAVPTRRALVEMATAGVLFNFALALILWAATLLLPAAGLSSALEFGAGFNLAVGLFNTIPLLPMDGGLLLATLLSRRQAYTVGWRRVLVINLIFALAIAASAIPLRNPWPLLLAGAALVHIKIAGKDPDPGFMGV